MEIQKTGNAADIAELSLAAQNAGGITAEFANQYINATDKAYQLRALSAG